MGAKIAKMGFRLDYGFSNSGVMGAVARGVLDNWRERQDKYYGDVTPIVGVTTREYYELYEKTKCCSRSARSWWKIRSKTARSNCWKPTSWFCPRRRRHSGRTGLRLCGNAGRFFENQAFYHYNVNGFSIIFWNI